MKLIIPALAGLLGVYFGIIKILPSSKYDNSLVRSCLESYRKIAEKLYRYNNNNNASKIEANDLIQEYFERTNEELFYIKNNLINPEIGKDWIAGIIRQLSFFKKNNPTELNDVFLTYPRVEATFKETLSENHTGKIENKLIDECLKKLKKFKHEIK
ncbi:MAG TPA: hypothetical protein VGB95_05310 [Chitinophagales bacterium]